MKEKQRKREWGRKKKNKPNSFKSGKGNILGGVSKSYVPALTRCKHIIVTPRKNKVSSVTEACAAELLC